jgi:hypothetical protein
VDWIRLSQDGIRWAFVTHGSETPGNIKAGNFLTS